MKNLLVTAVVLLLAACALVASPNLNGFSGNGVLADTSTTQVGMIDLALDYYLNNGDMRKNTFPVRANIGLAEGFEAGVGYTFQKSEELDHNAFNVNAKYALNVNRDLVTAAVGGKYSNISNLATITSAFLAADINLEKYFTKDDDCDLILTLGTTWTDIDPKRSPDGRRGFRYYAALKLKDGPVTFGGQYQTRLRALENHALYSIYAEYDLGARLSNIKAEAGYTNAGLSMVDGTGSGRLYFGLNYSFSARQF